MDDATALFVMDLAVELGQGLDHVLNMPEDEFRLWLLRSQIKPLSDSHYSTAKICQTIFASQGVKTEIADHMPIRPPEPEQTEEEIMAAFA